MTYLLKVLALVVVVVVAVTGCKKKEDKQVGEMIAPHGTMGKKNLPVVVPDSVKGKWKAVKVSVTDKSSNKSTEYTVPLSAPFAIPGTGLSITVEDFLPQFAMNADSVTSLSNDPKNPAAKARITEGGQEVFKGWLFAVYPSVHAFQHPKFSVILVSGIPAG